MKGIVKVLVLALFLGWIRYRFQYKRPWSFPPPPGSRGYGGVVNFTTAFTHMPETDQEVVDIIQSLKPGARVKMMGAGHSWTPWVQANDATSDHLLSLEKMSNVIRTELVDDAMRAKEGYESWVTGKVTVGAGIRLCDLHLMLHKHYGFALPNMGTIGEQSLAGALAMATHGSASLGFSSSHSDKQTPVVATLSKIVVGLRIIDGQGKIHDLTREDGDVFEASKVGLGLLGVITQMTVLVRNVFALEKHTLSTTPQAFFDSVQNDPNSPFVYQSQSDTNAKYYVSKCWMVPFSNTIKVFRWREIPVAEAEQSGLLTFQDVAVKDRYPESRIWLGAIASSLWYLGSLQKSIIPYLQSVIGFSQSFDDKYEQDVSYVALTEPVPFPFVGQEFYFPVDLGDGKGFKPGEVFDFYHALVREKECMINMVIEIRFLWAEPDSGLLSPNRDQNMMTMNLCLLNQRHELKRCAQEVGAAISKKFPGTRPHWGKFFDATKGFPKSKLENLYPDVWSRFQSVRKQMDPNGIFMNQWTQDLFG